jgi:phosphohistidine phosphatase
MRNGGVAPDLILTSPLLRAVQTADILAESLKYNGPLLVVNTLEPGFCLKSLKLLLVQYQNVKELVIVGHEPDLGSVAGALLGLSQGVAFKKGRALQLEIKPGDACGNAVFNWLASGNNLITSRKEACR